MERYALRVTTPPAEERVTLAQASDHLKLDQHAADTELGPLITAARAWCEKFQDRAYVTQTLTVKLDRFPCGEPIELLRDPLSTAPTRRRPSPGRPATRNDAPDPTRSPPADDPHVRGVRTAAGTAPRSARSPGCR